MARNRLEKKLQRIRKDPSGANDFIICDAKDGDMGGGIPMPGPVLDQKGKPTGRYKTAEDHLAQVTALVEQDILDMMLLSLGNLDRLNAGGVFSGSRMGTAIRANDTTDIWGARHSRYKEQPSVPHRTALVEHAAKLTDLGLYSITFMNDAETDALAGELYREFRMEAEEHGFKHFLEVFNPNVGMTELGSEEIGQFVNDNIVRVIAAVPMNQRPEFLKIVYNGPRALEELVAYDPSIIVGILGGGAGTTRDTFELLKASQKGGARVVLFGRKINFAEDPLSIVALMRQIVEGEVEPKEAVKAYHGTLQKKGLGAKRPLADDIEITEAVLKL
jgi:DhnA family fructose-bisphosphate aldolase class Ia